ncbi:hypothetical protein FOE78_12435 [Microlunatus elymi]|uniref:Uncharacterized protein n=1 Tax=Microlunatus elymi TaxID=2596828 RepID=A0A516PZL6_9ACTN|nr:hypothetical protein [Microlunatus elymi]QDP96610.1 hypothetical protein FOE78_12435 [Microlunatus elymi]
MTQHDSGAGVRSSRQRERGTGTLEYVAAIALAAVVAVGAILALQGGQFDKLAQDAICKVKTALGAGSCSGSQDPGNPNNGKDFDPKPKKCRISDHSEQVNSEIKIAFIKIGNNAGFIETTYSDGTVTYTATDGAGLGVTGGVGAKFDIGKLKAEAKVDFGAGVKFDYGSTWTFKDADEAKKMKDQLDDYLAQQEMMKQPGGAIAVLTMGEVDPPKPPNQSVTSIEVEGSATGSLGVSLPWDKQDDPTSSGSSSTENDSKVPNLKLAKAGLTIGGSGKWTQITNSDTDTTTYTTNITGYASADGTLGPLSGQVKGLLGSSMSITQDKDGKITNVTVTSTSSGSITGTVNNGQSDLGGSSSSSAGAGDVTVTTSSLNVSTDEQRNMINTWLDYGGIITPGMLNPTKAEPNDDIQNLFYQQAQSSEVSYDQITDKEGFAAEVKLGVALGVDFSLTTQDNKAVKASYLDAPDSSGVRTPVDFPECLG